MSPQRRAQRRAARMMLLGILAIVALIVSVWLVGAAAKSDIQASEARARLAQVRRDARTRQVQTTSLRAGCARAVARDFESWETNRDLRRFALDAAAVRRASGQVAVARRYQETADRAQFRMERIKFRLPAREDAKTVAAFCRALFPDPGTKG